MQSHIPEGSFNRSSRSRETAVGVAVPRVGGEPVGFGQGSRTQERRIDFEHGAVGHARAAHDAGRDAGQVQHRLVRDDVLLFRLGPLGLEVGLDLVDLVPKQVEIDDQVFDDRHVASGLHGDDVPLLQCSRRLCLAGQPGVPVDAHGAGAANGTAAGAAEAEGSVVLFPDLDQGIQHGCVVLNGHGVVLPERCGFFSLGVQSPYPERYVHRLVLPLFRSPFGDADRRILNFRAGLFFGHHQVFHPVFVVPVREVSPGLGRPGCPCGRGRSPRSGWRSRA